MRRVLYLCPDSNVPTGGIKVIYRHAQTLAAMGFDAHVLHAAAGFRCDWFEHDASVRCTAELRRDDLVVVPEVATRSALQLHGLGIRYAMFVQNGYLVLPSATPDELQRCYRHAELVLSISDDTTALLGDVFPWLADRVLGMRYSVDVERFRPDDDAPPRARLATYMPRKMPLHSANVVPWLAQRHPDWEFRALHGLPEHEVAAALRRSRVFLAFSDFEGCPVPPVEAALSGNVVLGYPGWGGREYWDEPNFLAVDSGDVRGFVRMFAAAERLALDPAIDARLAPGRRRLARRYGVAAERERLLALTERLGLAPSLPPRAPPPLPAARAASHAAPLEALAT